MNLKMETLNLENSPIIEKEIVLPHNIVSTEVQIMETKVLPRMEVHSSFHAPEHEARRFMPGKEHVR